MVLEDDHGLALRSIGIGATEWRPGAMRAVCNAGCDHSAPDPDCECGLYAYYLTLARDQRVAIDSYPSASSGKIWGVVSARGMTQLHERGFRSEEMRLVALIEPMDVYLDADERHNEYDLTLIRNLAKEYGVPLLSGYGELREWIKEGQLGMAGAPDSRPRSPLKTRIMESVFQTLDDSPILFSLVFSLTLSLSLAAIGAIIPALAALAIPADSSGVLSLSLMAKGYLVTALMMFLILFTASMACSTRELHKRFKVRRARRARSD